MLRTGSVWFMCVDDVSVMVIAFFQQCRFDVGNCCEELREEVMVSSITSRGFGVEV